MTLRFPINDFDIKRCHFKSIPLMDIQFYYVALVVRLYVGAIVYACQIKL